jgi:hypothetical protein
MVAVAGFTIRNDNLFDVTISPPGGGSFPLAPGAVSPVQMPKVLPAVYNIQPLGGDLLFQVTVDAAGVILAPVPGAGAAAFLILTQLA